MVFYCNFCLQISFMFSSSISALYTRWDVLLLSFFPALINFSILIYSSIKLNKTRVNIYFALFVFTLAFWQISEGMMRLSLTINEALLWYKASSIFILLVILFGNLFVFRFTELYKKIPNSVLLLFYIFPVFLFFICTQLNLDTVEIRYSKNWQWIANPLPSFVTIIISIWTAIGALMMLIPIWVYYFITTKGSSFKKQLMLLAIGLSFPILIGIVVELLFPLFFNINDIPVAAFFVTTFSIASLIAIGKYKMLDFSPKHHWDDIIESIQEGVLIVNNNGIIMYANKAFYTLVNYLPEELLGIPETNILINNPSEQSEEDIQIQTKDGPKIWVLISKTPYMDSKAKVIGSIHFYTNINQIKETKQDLKIINNELELYVYKASHDLRGPVSTILGLINTWKIDPSFEKSENYLSMIELTAKKLDNTLVSMTKAMKVKEVHVFEDHIEFDSLLDGILVNLANVEGIDNIRIIREINYQEIYLSNKFILETILQNLIENAIKYRIPDLLDSYLKITINKLAEGGIQITVKDNGRGIDPSIQTKVFDMYFRGNYDSKGSGLGLYLVKKSIEKLNGKITLESKVGYGSTFTLIFH